jgi:hypothetical protein
LTDEKEEIALTTEQLSRDKLWAKQFRFWRSE